MRFRASRNRRHEMKTAAVVLVASGMGILFAGAWNLRDAKDN